MPDWDNCNHEWIGEDEHDRRAHEIPVICVKCGCPGMQSLKNGSILANDINEPKEYNK